MIKTKVKNEEEFKQSTQDRVVVDFHAQWCQPCLRLAPVLEEMDVPVVKVDVDENPDLAQKHGVMSLPTLAVFEGEEELDRIVGTAQRSQIKKLFDNEA